MMSSEVWATRWPTCCWALSSWEFMVSPWRVYEMHLNISARAPSRLHFFAFLWLHVSCEVYASTTPPPPQAPTFGLLSLTKKYSQAHLGDQFWLPRPCYKENPHRLLGLFIVSFTLLRPNVSLLGIAPSPGLNHQGRFPVSSVVFRFLGSRDTIQSCSPSL